MGVSNKFYSTFSKGRFKLACTIEDEGNSLYILFNPTDNKNYEAIDKNEAKSIIGILQLYVTEMEKLENAEKEKAKTSRYPDDLTGDT